MSIHPAKRYDYFLERFLLFHLIIQKNIAGIRNPYQMYLNIVYSGFAWKIVVGFVIPYSYCGDSFAFTLRWITRINEHLQNDLTKGVTAIDKRYHGYRYNIFCEFFSIVFIHLFWIFMLSISLQILCYSKRNFVM